MQRRQVRPRGRGLERLDQHAAVEQRRRAGAGRRSARRAHSRPARCAAYTAPAARRTRDAASRRRRDRVGSRPPSRRSSGSACRPPCAPATGRRRRSASEKRVSSARRTAARRRARGRPASSCASASQPALEVGREPALVALRLRHRAHAQRDLGDHAERALGAGDELAQRRPGGARGRVAAWRARRAASRSAAARTLASIRPRPVETWPAERVATQPPTVAHS